MTWCKNHVAEKCAHQLPDQVFPYFFMKSESSLFRQHYITRNHQKAKLTPTPSKKIFSLQYPPAIKTYSHNPHLFTSKYKQCFFWRCGFFMLSAGKCGMSVVLSMFFLQGWNGALSRFSQCKLRPSIGRIDGIWWAWRREVKPIV